MKTRNIKPLSISALLLAFALLCVFISPPIYPQSSTGGGATGSSADYVYKYTATTSSHSASPWQKISGMGLQYFQLIWTGAGTRSSCAVTVQTSTDSTGTGPVTAITVPTCATDGASAITNFQGRYIRINPATMTGTGNTVDFTLVGYINVQSMGASVTANQGTAGAQAWPITAATIEAFLGNKTDAKNAGTSTEDISAMQVLKELSYLLQTPPTGLTPYSLVAGASANKTSVTTSATTLHGWYIVNTAATPRWVRIYNKASAPDPTTDTPVLRFVIPANGSSLGGGTNLDSSVGIALSLGLGFDITAAAGDTDQTACTAGDVTLNFWY